METVFNYCSEKAFFSSDEKKWINRIKKLIEEHPEDIRVIRPPGENNGCIYVSLPVSWLKIQPKQKKPKFTEEQKAKFKEILAAGRETRAKQLKEKRTTTETEI